MKFSFTGADDNTSVTDLFHASRWIFDRGHKVEWGVLIFPEKEGHPKNPGHAKRLEIAKRLPAAAHLCGQFVFDTILQKSHTDWYRDTLYSELNHYRRVQVNINARKRDFSSDEVVMVYKNLLKCLPSSTSIIFQWNEDSAEDITRFLSIKLEHSLSSRIEMMLGSRLHFLLDASKGKGVTPESWNAPGEAVQNMFYPQLRVGIAGGLNPENTKTQAMKFSEQHGKDPSWVDMESSLRYHPNNFAVGACVQTVTNYIEGTNNYFPDWNPNESRETRY